MTACQVPDEVWWAILSYIDPEIVITRLYAVCGEWCRLIQENMATFICYFHKIHKSHDFLFLRVPSLRTLDLKSFGYQFKYDSLTLLSALTALHLPPIQDDFHIRAKPILLELPRYTSLTSLTLGDARYRIPHGVEVPNLRSLTVYGREYATDSMVSGFTALRSLSLFRCDITDKSIGALTNLTSLHVFALRDRETVTIESLRRLPYLVHLDIPNCKEKPRDLSLLTTLESLVLNYVPRDDELCLLTRLRKLQIRFHTIHLTRNFVTSLSHLSSLDVMGTTLDRAIRREDLTHLVELKIQGHHHDVKNTRDFQLEHFHDGPVDWKLISTPGYRGRW